MKQINIKNCPYYLFNDMINVKNVNRSLLGIDKLSCESVNIYHIEYIAMKVLTM